MGASASRNGFTLRQASSLGRSAFVVGVIKSCFQNGERPIGARPARSDGVGIPVVYGRFLAQVMFRGPGTGELGCDCEGCMPIADLFRRQLRQVQVAERREDANPGCCAVLCQPLRAAPVTVRE